MSLDQECYNTSQLATQNPPSTSATTQDATSTMLTKESTISIYLSSVGTKQRLSKQMQPNNSFSKLDEKM